MAIVINGTGTISGISATDGLSSPQTGSVLQVVQGITTTATTVSSSTFTDTTLSATITPKFATSKILVMLSQSYRITRASAACFGGFRLLRGSSTVIWTANTEGAANSAPYGFGIGATGATNTQLYNTFSLQYLDSPATTSSTTYKTQVATYDGVPVIITQLNDFTACSSQMQLLEIAV
jgi:hypothetical protein